MRVLISGASGLIGTEVARQLKELGHEPVRLTRKKPAAEGEVYWNPAKGELDPAVIETIEAVVNLAGATTGKIPWTKRYMQEIIDSRIDSTRTLVKAINNASNKPKVLVSGSASGFYGDCADEWLSEESPKGTGFLSDLAARWEEEAKKANTRVVLVRTTLVMSKKLGALGKLLPIMKFGLGGALGTGKQWWAWISLEDEARAIIHLIQNEQASGAYNLTAPEPATCEQVIKALAKGLRRPAIFKIPTFLMRTVIGLAAEELLLCSQKMTSHRLQESGFEFKHPTLEKSVGYVLS
ncbi:TIGR01777 family oxidoreductase [Aquiluna sp. KACHI24]|uniref:TIGR01777 family oxidoreductase n=1 Tax=Aquiluna sp. KACHI24 TaxID=2968831 RepID=UPI00222E3C09|nr:TIGR01777 family oxidoreductase [Aquiluna sp. KACHI24]